MLKLELCTPLKTVCDRVFIIISLEKFGKHVVKSFRYACNVPIAYMYLMSFMREREKKEVIKLMGFLASSLTHKIVMQPLVFLQLCTSAGNSLAFFSKLVQNMIYSILRFKFVLSALHIQIKSMCFQIKIEERFT